MSIIDEALRKLGSETSQKEAEHVFRKNTADPMPDIGFVGGPRKRRPISFLLAVALVGTGLIVYLFLPNGHARFPLSSSDETTSHSTRLPNNVSQVAGYPPEEERD